MLRVLFLCQKNDILSQIAEGLINLHSDGHIQASSAGIEASPIPDLVKAKMTRLGIDTEQQQAKSFEEFQGEFFDYVIWIGNDLDKGLLKARSVWPECHVWHADPLDAEMHTGDNLLRLLELQTHLISAHVQLMILSQHEDFRHAAAS